MALTIKIKLFSMFMLNVFRICLMINVIEYEYEILLFLVLHCGADTDNYCYYLYISYHHPCVLSLLMMASNIGFITSKFYVMNFVIAFALYEYL